MFLFSALEAAFVMDFQLWIGIQLTPKTIAEEGHTS